MTALDEAKARHVALRARVDGTLGQVVDLHQPHTGYPGSEAHCAGCDLGFYAAEHAEWPCSTFELIERNTP